MSHLEGKWICRNFMECTVNCNHRTPHFGQAACHLDSSSCGTCAQIKVVIENGKQVYVIKLHSGNYLRLPNRFYPDTFEFHMDEKICICSDPCEIECPHGDFHNEIMGCIGDTGICGVACREATSDEILQLFEDHHGELQYIDAVFKQEYEIHPDPIGMPSLAMPEQPIHERTRRFLNLEL